MKDQNIEVVEQQLLKRQVQPTAMRILVMEFLLQQPAAVSLTDIENGFEQSDRVTLYRTLKTFEKKGIVHAIQEGNITKYALCPDGCTATEHLDTHLHFHCTECKRTFCLHSVKLPALSIPASYDLTEVSLVAKGVCESCNHKALQ